jgi:FKBP-type peptidyl-prolyl cis-trans isomerase FkpA
MGNFCNFEKKGTMKYVFVFLALAVTVFSCKKDDFDEEAQLQKDIEIIQQYLTDNGLTAESTSSGLHYIVNNTGNGPQPNASSNVTVAYVGYFTGGNTFDQSSASGATFNLQNVIQGWTEGIPKFKQGGSGTLLIPSKLGYGQNGNSSIPGNTVILFDIELLEVSN